MDDALSIARRAEGKIDTHEQICAERYKQILDNQTDGKKDRELIWAAITTGFAEVRAVVLKAGYGLIAALGAVVMLLLKKQGML